MTDKALELWTVEDVTNWLNKIGLGHKAELFQNENVDGKDLNSKTSSEDFKKLGLTGLQAKKIVRALEEIKANNKSNNNSTAVVVQGKVIGTEQQPNPSQTTTTIQDLTNTIATLQSDIAKLKISGGTNKQVYAYDPSTSVTQQSVKVPFCSGAVISGNQTHVLTVTLGPGECVRAEPGAMLYMSDWIEMNTKTGGQGWERFLTGQNIFLTEFTYHGPQGTADSIAFSPDVPGQIIPIRLEKYGGKIICQKGCLLASANTIDLSVEFTDNFGTGLLGGQGFMLQGVNGSGYAFLEARGVVIQKELRKGERLKVSTGCLVGFQHTVQYGITQIGGGLGNVLVGGEGLFVATLTGPGTIWLESQPLDRLIVKVAKAMKD